MLKKRFVICDKDIRYLNRIQEYLIKKNLKDFQIEIFSQVEDAISQSNRHAFEIFVVSERCFCKEMIEQLHAMHIFILKETSEPLEHSYPCLDKYQSIEVILANILERYTSQIGDRQMLRLEKRAKVISFYSATQTTNQTAFAFATSQILHRNGKKVLYLNLQPYSGLESLLHLEAQHDLTDVIYYALQHTDKFRAKIDYIKAVRGGIELLPPAKDYGDLLAMTKEEWNEWFEIMLYEAGYEILVFDYVGTGIFSSEFLQNSDVIFYVRGETDAQKACDLQFHDMLKNKDWFREKNSLREISLLHENVAQYEMLYLSKYGEYMRNQLKEAGILEHGTMESGLLHSL